MNSQQLLFRPIVRIKTKNMSIDESFAAFHRANPHVFRALRQLAMDMKCNGHDKYSINGLFEVLRWNYAMATTGDDFKRNNNYRAPYARLLMEKVPLLHQFFQVRERRNV